MHIKWGDLMGWILFLFLLFLFLAVFIWHKNFGTNHNIFLSVSLVGALVLPCTVGLLPDFFPSVSFLTNYVDVIDDLSVAMAFVFLQTIAELLEKNPRERYRFHFWGSLILGLPLFSINDEKALSIFKTLFVASLSSGISEWLKARLGIYGSQKAPKRIGESALCKRETSNIPEIDNDAKKPQD